MASPFSRDIAQRLPAAEKPLKTGTYSEGETSAFRNFAENKRVGRENSPETGSKSARAGTLQAGLRCGLFADELDCQMTGAPEPGAPFLRVFRLLQVNGQCLVARAIHLACSAFKGEKSGTDGCCFVNDRFPREFGVRHAMPGAVSGPVARSETMYALESHTTPPPLFELKDTPLKSALELTRTRIAGPMFCAIVPPRRNASEFPSTRTAALRGSPATPLL